MINEERVREHRARALSPDHPVLRGTAQNPDVFFQARETVNPFYAACPDMVQRAMDRFAELTGRRYRLFDYHGAPDAERVIVLMGSGCEAAHETVDYLTSRGEKVGVLKVRLYRPFDVERFAEALPASVKAIAVLDRTKEPGSAGEPLYLDCVNALHEDGTQRCAQSSAGVMVCPRKNSRRRWSRLRSTTSQRAEPEKPFHCRHPRRCERHEPRLRSELFRSRATDVFRALFYGLGSDGTVGANKNSIKIIGENTANYAQGYFVYDSKKAGAMTVSHLRFGPRPIRSTYLISEAQFVACHQPFFLERYDMLAHIAPGGVFLLNTPVRAGARLGTAAESAQRADHREARALFRDRRAPGCA